MAKDPYDFRACGKRVHLIADEYDSSYDFAWSKCVREAGHTYACQDSKGRVRNNQTRRSQRR